MFSAWIEMSHEVHIHYYVRQYCLPVCVGFLLKYYIRIIFKILQNTIFERVFCYIDGSQFF